MKEKRVGIILKSVGLWLLLLACSGSVIEQEAATATSLPPSPSKLAQKIIVTQNPIGPYPKTGVGIMTFPLYNGCPDTITPENQSAYQQCVDKWIDVTIDHLQMLEADVFRIPFGAKAANQIINSELLKPLETRPEFTVPFPLRSPFAGDTMMVGWPEAQTLAQATNTEVMWVLNVRDICIFGVCGTGSLEDARSVVQALKGKVRYYELGSEDYRPCLLAEYKERIARFGGMIQQEDPDALFAAVLRDDFVWPEGCLDPALTPVAWKDQIVAQDGPHRLQRHLFFPTSDRLKFHKIGTELAFPVTITQPGPHTFTFTFEDAHLPDDVQVKVGATPLQWTQNGFTGNLAPGLHQVTITSATNQTFSMKFVFDVLQPDGQTRPHQSVLEGRSGWELYMAGPHGIGDNFIPQDIGDRKVWISEIAEHGVAPAREADGRSGHRWLDAMAYASGFMLAASDPRVEIILGHTLYEVAWNGMVGGVGRVPWAAWDSVETNISPKPRPKFWVHQQMARHMKNGQQVAVQMPVDYFYLDGGLQMGYSGREAQQIPLLACWGSETGAKRSLLCLNRAYNQSFTYPVEFAGSEAATAQMTLLTGEPGDHNEGDQPVIQPQIQTVQLSGVTFPPRSLVRLEVSGKEAKIFLPITISDR